MDEGTTGERAREERMSRASEKFAQDPGESIGERVDTRIDPHTASFLAEIFLAETRWLVRMAVLIELVRG